ncbi:SRPBCC domain-containing protein [Aestuariibius sp. 2305UL40-4]|uniref:SRPBCC domain-containing protein n=1 Tax=Aestuariibius violaceus TaxID=3234132 RepID=UPI00345E7E61
MSDNGIRKHVSVALPRDEAFRVFVEEIGAWWPKNRDPEKVRLKPGFGGSLIRETPDGEEEELAKITEWEPGERLVLTWTHGDDAIELELTFTETAEGTRIDLRELPLLPLTDAVAACRWLPDPRWVLMRFAAYPVIA